MDRRGNGRAGDPAPPKKRRHTDNTQTTGGWVLAHKPMICILIGARRGPTPLPRTFEGPIQGDIASRHDDAQRAGGE